MPATTDTARSRGGSLGTRLFLLAGTLVLATVVASVGLTSLRAGQVSREWVRETLAASITELSRFERERTSQLRQLAHFVAGDPAFVAYVTASDPLSVRDLLIERQRDIGCDLLVLLDRSGRLVARTDRAGGTGLDLSSTPLVAEMLRGGESAGLWSDGEGYWHAVTVPILSGGEIAEGILIAGLAIDDAFASDLRRRSGAEIAYVTPGPEPRVVATSLEARPSLQTLLSRRPDILTSRGDRTVEIDLDGARYSVRTAPPRASDGAGWTAVILAPLDQVLAPFRRIERALVAVGLFSLMGAFALSYALSRRITRPLEQLADAAEAAREGRYDRPLPTGGTDEVGRLARSFDTLLTELREERELAAYLRTLSRSQPSEPVATPLGDGVAEPGTLLAGRFEILSWIGSGGMGAVYRARDRELNEMVAVKTLHHGVAEADALEALKAELRIARRITHRNVIRTHDFGEAGGTAFISMEYVPGITLRRLMDQTSRLPTSVALRIVRQVLNGLEAAHALGVVHRDIKPENLIVDPAGQVKIADFGIARMSMAASTSPGSISGTLGYLSPEQLSGAPNDARADLYAVGVVLYELLSGRRPFTAHDPVELTYRVMNEQAPPLHEHAEVPRPLSDVVMTCLRSDPNERFRDVGSLLRALEQARR